MGRFAVGQAVARTEDPRLLSGRGRFVDDIALPGLAHAVFLRSPHAHARIVRVDAGAARSMPGVLAVLTSDDLRNAPLGALPLFLPRFQRDGRPALAPARPPLANARALLVGDPVALVVAESVALAKDAAEAIDVEYAALPLATVWPDCPANESFFYAIGDKATVDAAFARASHVTELTLRVNRVTHATMEPRGCIGVFDTHDERYTLYIGTQRPHATRENIARRVLGIPETALRVVSYDLGGSFGLKNEHYPEYGLVLFAARRIGRPVKWIAERSESMATDDHDRDLVAHAALALDAHGRFLALRTSNVADIGAYLNFGGVVSPTAHLGGLSGTYTTGALYAEVSAVFSHTSSCGPYRGSGRPEAAYIVERLIDNAARATGIDRAELRRRNTIGAAAMPYRTGFVFTYDCGDFAHNLERALEIAGYAGFEARRAESRHRGRLRGIGFANVIEQASGFGGETVEVRLDASGGVTVIPGSIPQGQGHETMYKILVSDRLGIDADVIRVTKVDTDLASDGGGSYASRTAVLGGSATSIAVDRVIAKARRIAAHLLEAAETDVGFDAGEFRVAGTDRTIALQAVAQAAHTPSRLPAGMETGLAESASFAPEIPNFPNGCHVCELEIDPETGVVTPLAYTVVDDVGTVLNPLTLEGQIAGGIGQGFGQALGEQILYDRDSGQLLTGSFMDYAIARADQMCAFELESHPVPTRTNPLGAKGAGEAGNVGALAAIMNAVVDALAPLGVLHLDMPATPERVWRAMRAR